MDDVVTHGDISGIDGGASLTVCLWVNPDALAAANVFIGKIQAGVNFSFLVGTRAAASADAECQISAGVFGYVVGSLTTGTWKHFSWVYDGSGAVNADRLKMWMDGVAQTLTFSGTIPATMPDTGTNAVKMGSPNGEGTRGFADVKLAHIKMWTAVLTAAQVIQEMNSFRPVRTANLVLWAPYDDGTSARDYSGSGNHGTVTGALQTQGPPVSYGGM